MNTFTTQRGVKFHYDSEFTAIVVEEVTITMKDEVQIDGDDFVEFLIHITANSQGFRKKYSLVAVEV